MSTDTSLAPHRKNGQEFIYVAQITSLFCAYVKLEKSFKRCEI